MSETKKLFLLDAMALIYRAYFGLNKTPRINSKGFNTSTVMGFANTLYEVLKKEKPTHIGVAFDTMAPTLRQEGYVQYKAHREAMPDDIALSLPYIDQLLDAFKIPKLFVDGYEADDVVGTLSKKAEQAGFTTYMMTSDKDFCQLVSENIFVYKPARMGNKPEILGVKEVCEKYDIQHPEQLIDILGIWGDAADNIPGIPGVGEVTAKKLIKQFGSVENLIANADKLEGKLKENVINFAAQAYECKALATIILDVPIAFDEEALKLSEPDPIAMKALLDELEMRNFAQRVFTDLSLKTDSKPVATKSSSGPDLFSSFSEEEASDQILELESTEETTPKKTIADVPHEYHLVDTQEKINDLVSKLSTQASLCFDTETTGVDANSAELVGLSFSFKSGEAYYIPVPENYNDAVQITKCFKSILENPDTEKIAQNIKYDIAILKWYDIQVQGKLFDTMLAHYLIEPDMRHNMDVLAETYLNYSPISYESMTGKGKTQIHIRQVPLELLKDYACEDADITLQLKLCFEPKLIETDTRGLFDNIEIPLVKVLASMEAEGVKIDVENLHAYSAQLQIEVVNIEQEIKTLAGTDFNIASPKQLGEVLFDKLKIVEKPKVTKTKQYATGEDVLQKLVNKHPIVEKILDYRSLTKLKSTYVDTLPLLINQRTGRVHTSYNQAVAATGRLSSNNPNLQNIPIRTERGREIRKAFVPRNAEYTFLSADYSQIELRLMADMSKDEKMIDAFKHGLDIHTATAARVYGVELDQVTKDQRRNAKMVNFGIIYGISAFGLSERLNIPRGEAKEIIDQYFTQYSAVKAYMDNTIEFARQHGYVETIMKRRRYVRDINASNSVVRGYAERNAINAPIQGSAADMIKIAMIHIHDEFLQRNLRSRMILQVHDELNFDTHLEEVDIVQQIVADKMKNAMQLSVPLDVEMHTGINWLEAH